MFADLSLINLFINFLFLKTFKGGYHSSNSPQVFSFISTISFLLYLTNFWYISLYLWCLKLDKFSFCHFKNVKLVVLGSRHFNIFNFTWDRRLETFFLISVSAKSLLQVNSDVLTPKICIQWHQTNQ